MEQELEQKREPQQEQKTEPQELTLSEKLVNVKRVAKVVKGGKHLRFSALVVVGDGNGQVGVGMGKANEVPQAIQKAGAIAKRRLTRVPLRGTTIPHEVIAKFGAAKVLLKPAAPGTGVIAGSSVRAVLEVTGVKDILTKSLGNSNPTNLVKATILALKSLREPEKALALRRASPGKKELERGG